MIKEKRQIAGYTQEEIARLLGVTLRTYINIEQYKTLPNIMTGLALAKLLNCSPYELWKI